MLYIAERGLALRGTVEKLGDRSNGNFLGILELLAQSDPLLQIFLDQVCHHCSNNANIQALVHVQKEIRHKYFRLLA